MNHQLNFVEINGYENFVGGLGSDTIVGFGDNSVGIVGGQGIDILYGSEIDYLRYDLEENYRSSSNVSGVKVNLENQTATDTFGNNDVIYGFGNIKGTSLNDELIGDNKDNIIEGNDGDDIIIGLGGNDTLRGGSGSDILDGGIGNEWGFVSEFNSWANGTICTHGKISTQCSGVLVTKDGGKTYDNIDWHGTDGVDTDAMTGSFPTSKIWYIAGGLVQAESNPGPSFKSTIMKTMDGIGILN